MLKFVRGDIMVKTDFWESEDILGEVDKNTKEKYIVKRVSSKGKFYKDIRVYYLDSTSNEYKPSSKGVVIPEDKIGEIIKLISNDEL